ncbi:MAG: STAS domain-containing protein [Opitutales bacterium]|nr:STAS domain-containing protein [Opitutales bacterium]
MSINEYATFDRAIHWKKVDGVIVLSIQNYLDADLTPKLEVAFKELSQGANLPIIIDGSNWQFVTPTGLGVFLKFIQRVKPTKRSMALANPTELIRTIWGLSGLQAIAPIYDTLKQAIRALSKDSAQTHKRRVLPLV